VRLFARVIASSYSPKYQYVSIMKQNRDGPGSGLCRGRGSPRGDPNLRNNNRSRAPSKMHIMCHLTG